MKRKGLKTIDTEVLQKKHKTFKMAFYVLAGLIGVMFVVSFFSWKEGGFNATVLMPAFFIPMILVNYMNVRKIRKEIESRNP